MATHWRMIVNEVIEKQHTGEVLEAGDMTESEEIAEGRAIFKSVDLQAWALGKWYAGVQDRRKNPTKTSGCNSAQGQITSSSEQICKSVGFDVTNAGRSANAYRLFGHDKYNLPFRHYVMVLPLIEEQGEEAGRQMLLQAQKGERFKDEFEDYGYGEPWNRLMLNRALKIAMGKISKDLPQPEVVDQGETSVLSQMDKVVRNSGLNTAERKKIKAALTQATKAAFQKLKDEYHDSLDAAVKKRFDDLYGDQEQELFDRMKAVDEAEDLLSKHTMTVNALMTEHEFNKLRSFSHPDKNGGREEEARVVFDIVQKLKTSFHPASIRKQDLESQGWKK